MADAARPRVFGRGPSRSSLPEAPGSFPRPHSIDLPHILRLRFLKLCSPWRSSLEQPKVVLHRDRLVATLRLWIHVLPVTASLLLVAINSIGMTTPLYSTNGNAALQFVAKLLEMLIQASLGDLYLALIRIWMLNAKCIPLGAIVAPLQASKVSHLWSLEFWASVTPSWLPTRRKMLLMFATIIITSIAALAGPSVAVLMIPRPVESVLTEVLALFEPPSVLTPLDIHEGMTPDRKLSSESVRTAMKLVAEHTSPERIFGRFHHYLLADYWGTRSLTVSRERDSVTSSDITRATLPRSDVTFWTRNNEIGPGWLSLANVNVSTGTLMENGALLLLNLSSSQPVVKTRCSYEYTQLTTNWTRDRGTEDFFFSTDEVWETRTRNFYVAISTVSRQTLHSALSYAELLNSYKRAHFQRADRDWPGVYTKTHPKRDGSQYHLAVLFKVRPDAFDQVNLSIAIVKCDLIAFWTLADHVGTLYDRRLLTVDSERLLEDARVSLDNTSLIQMTQPFLLGALAAGELGYEDSTAAVTISTAVAVALSGITGGLYWWGTHRFVKEDINMLRRFGVEDYIFFANRMQDTDWSDLTVTKFTLYAKTTGYDLSQVMVRLSLVVVVMYCVIATAYIIWTLVVGETSSSWDTIGGLIMLALNSRRPSNLKNVGAGADTLSTYREPVLIQANDEDALEMVFPNDPTTRGLAFKNVNPNQRYG